MSERLFQGRTALVTGGARGIGRAICQMLGEHGARVAINYSQNDKAAFETLNSIEALADKVIVVKADVSKPKDVARMTETIREQLGPIDLLINNAGIASREDHSEVNLNQWKRMFEINVDGPFLTTWAVKDEMIARRYGRIVNVASVVGLKMTGRMIPYASSKAALISFTRHCAEAFAPYNIRVNCVAPGLTNTELARSTNANLLEHLISVTPMQRMGEPPEIASVVKFLLSEDSSFITGQTVSACGGRV